MHRYNTKITRFNSQRNLRVVSSQKIGRAVCQDVNIEFRILILGIISLILTCGILARLYYLQAGSNNIWKRRASSQFKTEINIKSARGSIFDRNGNVLSTSVPALALAINPRNSKDVESLLTKIDSIVDIDVNTLSKQIKDRNRFTWVGRNFPLSYEEDLRKLVGEGLEIFREFDRFYPQGQIAGNILGRLSVEGKAQAGAELQFDKTLTAENTNSWARRDAKGRIVRTGFSKNNSNLLKTSAKIEKRNSLVLREEGKNIELSIDSVIQSILEEELVKGVEASKAKSATAVIMDPESGEILALAQVPSIDPNAKNGIKLEDLKNKALQNVFEPGSTMKPFVAAAAIENKIIGINDIIDCGKGATRFGSKIVRDVHPVGVVPFYEALARSSNICMAKVASKIGKDNLFRMYKKLGVGDKTGVELPGETSGLFRDLRHWKKIDLVTHSYGHGLALTTVQLARAYSVLANGGYLIKPTILKDKNAFDIGEHVFSSSTVDSILFALEKVTNSDHGTGKKAAIQGVKVYGKTGTAHKVAETGGYDPEKVIASFAGFIDADIIGVKSRPVMVVAVDEPGINPRWGGVVAAPIFKNVMERVITHLLRSYPVERHIETAFKSEKRGNIG